MTLAKRARAADADAVSVTPPQGPRPLRTILFVPGDRPEWYDKALAARPDAICIDLEDSVGPAAKEAARVSVLDFLAQGERKRPCSSGSGAEAGLGFRPGPWVIVRINDPERREGRADIRALETLEARRGPDAFMIPKVAGAVGLIRARAALGKHVPVFPIIETPLGLERAAEVARAATGAAKEDWVRPALVFGGIDFAAALGVLPYWEALLYARSRVVHAAATGGIDVIDMPVIDIGDEAALWEEAVRAARLGFTGKLAIHPRQVPVIHEALGPSKGDIERARRILQTDRASGGGAVLAGGQMVDRPLARWARRVLVRAGISPPE